MGGLRVLLARVLRVAGEVVALLLRDVVRDVGADLLDVLVGARGVLVARVELGLGDAAVAFRLHVAHVLGVAGQLVALLLRGLVLGFDAVLLGLVRLAGHLFLRDRGAGRAEPERDHRGGDCVAVKHEVPPC